MSSTEDRALGKSVRYTLDVRARLRVDGQEFTVRTRDISEGGIGVVSPVEIPSGSDIEVELFLPAVQESLVAKVELKRASGFRYGLRFRRITSETREQVRRYARRWGIVAERDW